LRAGSRRCHRPTGQIQQPGRTQDWIKLGGKVRIAAEQDVCIARALVASTTLAEDWTNSSSRDDIV
ncbi:hypothetical protein, partial [Bradyrhizobium sp. S3.2.12]|uniref:hypothetical protein n=1 Tax=Bradyrhizobium sp. S3.2.12 TaxID=3156387 RepID=UPI003395F246